MNLSALPASLTSDAAAIAATAAILRDAELDDLKARLDRLEERKGCT